MERAIEVQVVVSVPMIINMETGAVDPNGRPYVSNTNRPWVKGDGRPVDHTNTVKVSDPLTDPIFLASMSVKAALR